MSDTSLVFALSTRDRTAAGMRSARQTVQGESDAMANDVGQSGDSAGSKFGENLKAGAAAAVVALGAVVAAGFAEAMDQSRLSDKLAAQLGLTEAESARVGKVAGDLYANAYGDSFESVNTAVGAVMSSIKGMTDASSADLESVTANALDFATAFDVDVTRAAQVAGTAINIGLAKDATEAFDLITSASQKVPASLREDLLDSVDEYGQFFRTIGFSGKEAFAVLVDASEKGQFGIDKFGDSVKEFTLLATDLDATGEAYKKIGLDANEMANALLAGGDTARDATGKIVDGLLGIKDPTEQAAAAIAFFGTPLEDLNKADIPDFLKAMDGASGSMDDFKGAATRMGNTLNDNAATRIETFKRTMQQKLVNFLGGTVIPAMDGFKQKVADTFGGLWDEAGKGNAEGVDRVLEFFSLLGRGLADKAVELAPKAIAALVEFGQKVADYVVANPEQVLKIAAIAGALITAIAMLPLLAAGALTAAGVTMMLGFVNGLITKLDENLPKWWASFTGWVGTKAGQAGQAFNGLGTAIGQWFSGLWSRYVSGPVGRAWNSFLGSVRTLPARAGGALASLGPTLGRSAGNAFQRFRDAAGRKASDFMRWASGLPGRIGRAVGSLSTLLWGKGQDVVRGLWNGIRSMGPWLASTLSGWAKSLIPGPIAKALGIGSPSKVMAEVVGRWIPAGIVQGIDSGQDRLEDRMTTLVDPGAARSAAAPAPLVGGGGGMVHVRIDLIGDDENLKRRIKKITRVDGRGNVQLAFGQ